jgi:hypothetical protein
MILFLMINLRFYDLTQTIFFESNFSHNKRLNSLQYRMASGISNIITENEITVKIKVPTICTTIDSLKYCLHTFSTNMWEKSRSAQLLFLNCQQRAQITLKLNSGRDWESPSQHRHTHTLEYFKMQKRSRGGNGTRDGGRSA